MHLGVGNDDKIIRILECLYRDTMSAVGVDGLIGVTIVGVSTRTSRTWSTRSVIPVGYRIRIDDTSVSGFKNRSIGTFHKYRCTSNWAVVS